MANRDIYDQSFFPPVLKKTANSLTLFKKFFYENNCLGKPVIQSHSEDKSWVTECKLIKPKEISFTGKGLRKKDSEGIAMAKALMWLRDNNYVDNSFNGIQSNENQIRQFYDQISAPIEITGIQKTLKSEMNRFCHDFDTNMKNRITDICANSQTNSNSFVEVECNGGDVIESPDSKNSQKTKIIKSIFNNRVYEEPKEMDLIHREIELNLFLKHRKEREKSDKSYGFVRQKISELPINRFKEQILETISQNRVIVISGDTGCGKTTQVPQMIFENEIINQRSAFANIIVTQPRRLSAIAISERIALEFGEQFIGNSIGYNVRFDKSLPKHTNGVILFCSAGILLRKMGSNAGLKGVSHVIIDEVHERDVITDFLLVLLKRALSLNPNVKIILMSASMNANLFVNYFECPLIEIPGRCYAVKNFYLNDFSQKIGSNGLDRSFSPTNPKLDLNLITDLINYIDRTKGEGAILVFLPGWLEIQNVSNSLALRLSDSSNRLMVVPLHSKLPHSSQRQIFAKTGAGVRKVILSTNIAETSLTIDDVVYVIDSGLAKEMRYNSKLNVSNFGTHWISRANAIQRSGRAGRVKEGECYRIYSREIESSFMDEFPTPELLRIPLENVVMQSKLHFPKELVAHFLSAVPQPPSHKAIEKAVNSLKEINVLNNREELTLLGQKIVNFTTHPRLSVALVYSSFFCCLKSMLALASQLSETREPFQVRPDQKVLIRQIKNKFSSEFLSDHLSLVILTLEYQTLSEQKSWDQMKTFQSDNNLNRYLMENVLQTMKLFANDLEESKLISKQVWNNVKSGVNFNYREKYLLVSALVPAFVPNFVRLVRGEVKKGKLKNNSIQAIDVISGSKVKFSGESVFNANFNACGQLERLCNSLIVYFKSYYSEDTRMLTICDASLISPISLLLFKQNFEQKSAKTISDEECVVSLKNNKYLSFKLKTEDLKLICRWSSILELFFQWYIISQNVSQSDVEENDKIYSYLHDFLQLTEQLIKESS